MPSSILDRFIEQFPNVIEHDRACQCWRALNAASTTRGASKIHFGITEFSISLKTYSETSIRWLAEITHRQSFTRRTLTQVQEIGEDVISSLSDLFEVSYPLDTFRELLRHLYSDSSGTRPARVFRLGYAVEFQASSHPGFRWYAEPRTIGSNGDRDRVGAIAKHLDLAHHWEQADREILHIIPQSSLRGIGIDFSPQNTPSLKIYYSTRAVSWHQIEEVSTPSAATHPASALAKFHVHILKERNQFPPNTILLGVILTTAQDPEVPIIKWDVFLPQLHTSDHLVQERILDLCRDLGVEGEEYLRLWSVVTEGDSPERLVNVHQYASLDLIPEGQAKLNIYLRPPGRHTEHMPNALRPRVLRNPGRAGRIATAIQRGIINLADARQDDFAEMQHRMIFPQEAGFKSAETDHVGAVFQRAILCRTLATARICSDLDRRDIQGDIDFLLSQQDPHSGGWKYFPSLLELPPDSDDVAQVMLAFIEVGDPRTNGVFAPVLQLIEEIADPVAGHIPTWLVDASKADARSQYYRTCIERWWGDGADPEVVANLGYALYRHDPKRFETWLRHACIWLAAVQNDDGWWESTWYWGRTYGTWMATRMIAAICPGDPALDRTANWWMSSRSEVGSWGAEKTTVLETAFGLEIGVELARADRKFPSIDSLLQSANWLCDHQALDGSWQAEKIIRMDVHRAASQRGFEEPLYKSYGSRTLTTGLCVQALVDLSSLSV